MEKDFEKKIGFRCWLEKKVNSTMFMCFRFIAQLREFSTNQYLIKNIFSQKIAALIFEWNPSVASNCQKIVYPKDSRGMGNRLCAFSIKKTLHCVFLYFLQPFKCACS